MNTLDVEETLFVLFLVGCKTSFCPICLSLIVVYYESFYSISSFSLVVCRIGGFVIFVIDTVSGQ